MKTLILSYIVYAVLLPIGASAQIHLYDAASSLDQQYDATGSFAANAAIYNQSLAQTFTVGIPGLLSQVDLMLERFPEAIGTFTVSILPTSGGVPLIDVTPLFSQSYPVTSITITNYNGASISGYTFFPFDLSSAGIVVSPGDVLAVAVTHDSQNGSDWVLWAFNQPPAGPTYSRGNAWRWSSHMSPENLYRIPNENYGFRTFVEPNTVPEPGFAALLVIGAVVLLIFNYHPRQPVMTR